MFFNKSPGMASLKMIRGAAIAQWICLCLPSCCPRFDSQACHQRFFSIIVEFVLYLSMRCWEKNKNKQKRGRIWPILKNLALGLVTYFLLQSACWILSCSWLGSTSIGDSIKSHLGRGLGVKSIMLHGDSATPMWRNVSMLDFIISIH